MDLVNKKLTKKLHNSVGRKELVSFLDSFLKTSHIKDYSCNGLQVQGTDEINKVALLVDASLEGYRQAVSKKCQMAIVHHGIIWDGIRSVSGSSYSHLKYLLDNNLNLYASHLPLDLHPEVGNNAQLAKILKISSLQPFGNYKGIDIGFEGSFINGVQLDEIVHLLCKNLDCECTVLPFGKKVVKKIGVVSGGAADILTEAIDKDLDCYITGEPAHYNYHKAMENEINVIYAGHYHTEKTGVQALGIAIHKQFGIETEFIDIPTSI